MKNKQEKNYSVANEFKDLDTKVVSAIREILSITLQIRNPMPSDGIELEFWIGMLETMNIELNTIVKLCTLFENESIIDINYPDLLAPDSGWI